MYPLEDSIRLHAKGKICIKQNFQLSFDWLSAGNRQIPLINLSNEGYGNTTSVVYKPRRPALVGDVGGEPALI